MFQAGSFLIKFEEDFFRVLDRRNRCILVAPLRPLVVSHGQDGRLGLDWERRETQTSKDTCRWSWERVDQQASLEWTWRVCGGAIIAEPVRFSSTHPEAIESVSFFAESGDNGEIRAKGLAHRRIVPGIAMGPEMSPIQHRFTGINGEFSLGRGKGPTIQQQWGLPSHFFCMHSHAELGSREYVTEETSDTLCLGLLDFPVGDVLLDLQHAHCALRFARHEQLHPKPVSATAQARELTPPLAFTVGKDSREAMRAYFEVSVAEFHGGQLPAFTWSAKKRRNAFAIQSNTWGVEVARQHKRFTSESLRGIYRELCQPEDGVEMFVIDDKWESTYGHLTHCSERLPDFIEILEEIRADGRLIGLWAAFLRCESPESVGLGKEHMLTRPDGTAFFKSNEEGYYLYDATQLRVRAVLTELVRTFARKYRPDLIKFDFGYEIPEMKTAQPADPTLAGDRFLQEALQLIVGTLREELPDLVMMYYGISPLMLGLCDLHGPDDLFMATGDYAMEANRRFYFASVCAEFGMPVYSSAAYDWKSVPAIWFDALASGTLGSLPDPVGDEEGKPMPEQLRQLRSQLKPLIGEWTQCRIETVGAQETCPMTGCTAPGWLRYQKEKLVFAALRPHQWNGLEPVPIVEGLAVQRPTVIASTDGEDIRTSQHVVKVTF